MNENRRQYSRERAPKNLAYLPSLNSSPGFNKQLSQFWKKSDKFRSKKVWWIKNNRWYKDNIWGAPSSYGKVFLSRKDRYQYEV